MIAALAMTLALLGDPASRVEAFYRAHSGDSRFGIPTTTQVAEMREFLSDDLYARFVTAAHYSEDWRRRFPDEPSRDGEAPVIYKPPCAEVDFFASEPEWPDVEFNGDDHARSFDIVRTERVRGNTWRVRVRFRYDTTPRVEWEDTVVVKREHGRYVISEVTYGDRTESDRIRNLSDVLSECSKD